MPGWGDGCGRPQVTADLPPPLPHFYFRCRLRAFKPLTLHASPTPWSVFRDGSDPAVSGRGRYRAVYLACYYRVGVNGLFPAKTLTTPRRSLCIHHHSRYPLTTGLGTPRGGADVTAYLPSPSPAPIPPAHFSSFKRKRRRNYLPTGSSAGVRTMGFGKLGSPAWSCIPVSVKRRGQELVTPVPTEALAPTH